MTIKGVIKVIIIIVTFITMLCSENYHFMNSLTLKVLIICSVFDILLFNNYDSNRI